MIFVCKFTLFQRLLHLYQTVFAVFKHSEYFFLCNFVHK